MDAPESEEHRLFSLISGFRASQLVRAAVVLGLPDLVGDEPTDVESLAAATQTHAPSLRRGLRALASMGLLIETDDGRFGGTALSARLRSNSADRWRAMAVAIADEGYAAWGDLLNTLRTGEPAFPRVFGESFFDHLARDPSRATDFNRWMAAGAAEVAAAIVDSYDFPAVGTVIDVGGGDGTLLAAILGAGPGLHGVVFDRPSALAGAPETLARQGVAGRCELIAGSFFEAVPRGDLYLLMRVLHDWDDEQALQILQTCRAAMRPGNRLLVIETILPDRVTRAFAAERATMLDMQMLVMFGGRERSEADTPHCSLEPAFAWSGRSRHRVQPACSRPSWPRTALRFSSSPPGVASVGAAPAPCGTIPPQTEGG